MSFRKIQVLILLTLLVSSTGLAAPSKVSPWLKGMGCGIVLSGAIFLGPAVVDSHYDLKMVASRYEIVSRAFPASEGVSVSAIYNKAVGAIIQGPVMSIMAEMRYRMAGFSAADAFLSQVKAIGLYTSVVLASRGVSRMFFSVPHESFLEKTEARIGKNPERVLYLDLIHAKDRLAGYPIATFNRLYGNHPDATYLKFENANQFRAALSEFKGRPFDRIEVYVHGKPGRFEVTDANGVITKDAKFAELLSSMGFPLSHSQTDLRMISCSLLNGQATQKNGVGAPLKEFVNAVLPFGGRVFGASKNIKTFEFFPDPVAFQNSQEPWSESAFTALSYFLGAESFRMFLSNLMSLNRNYLDALSDVVVFEVGLDGKIKRSTQEHN